MVLHTKMICNRTADHRVNDNDIEVDITPWTRTREDQFAGLVDLGGENNSKDYFLF